MSTKNIQRVARKLKGLLAGPKTDDGVCPIVYKIPSEEFETLKTLKSIRARDSFNEKLLEKYLDLEWEKITSFLQRNDLLDKFEKEMDADTLTLSGDKLFWCDDLKCYGYKRFM
jgi:hypothetical protein